MAFFLGEVLFWWVHSGVVGGFSVFFCKRCAAAFERACVSRPRVEVLEDDMGFEVDRVVWFDCRRVYIYVSAFTYRKKQEVPLEDPAD